MNSINICLILYTVFVYLGTHEVSMSIYTQCVLIRKYAWIQVYICIIVDTFCPITGNKNKHFDLKLCQLY